MLAEHLDAVLEAGADLLSSFPWQWKAALLAVARRSVRMHSPFVSSMSPEALPVNQYVAIGLRQGMLDDEALALLADEEMPVLNLAGARRLTSSTISAALQGMPLLRALDLSFCAFDPGLLASLHELAPRLEVLRLQGVKAAKAAAQALAQSLPRLSQPEDAAESWEDAAEARHAGFQVRLACASSYMSTTKASPSRGRVTLRAATACCQGSFYSVLKNTGAPRHV